jgi:hypothetical protein
MKAKYEQPVDRNIIITMKESEAKILRDYIGQQDIDDIQNIIEAYEMDLNASEVNEINYNLYSVICDLVGEEE